MMFFLVQALQFVKESVSENAANFVAAMFDFM